MYVYKSVCADVTVMSHDWGRSSPIYKYICICGYIHIYIYTYVCI